MIADPSVSLACGSLAALQRNLLECGNMPRIHEAVLASLLRLANTACHRHHTVHLVQVLAPYTDYHYKHTPHDLSNVTSR